MRNGMRLGGGFIIIGMVFLAAGCQEASVVSVGAEHHLADGTITMDVVFTTPAPAVSVDDDGRIHATYRHMECHAVIPPGYDVDHVEVIPGPLVTIPESVAYRNQLARELGNPAHPRLEVHRRESLESTVWTLGVQRRRGVSIFMSIIATEVGSFDEGIPLDYYATATLRLTLTASDEAPRIRYRDDPYRPLEDYVDNPEAIDAYRALGQEVPLISEAICSPHERYDYVIITSQELANSWEDYTLMDFVAQKSRQGFRVAQVLVEDIDAGYPGRDISEKIRNFITDAYNHWETDFVLMAGDANQVPMRGLYMMTGIGPMIAIASDVYSQCLDGSYNSNGNDQWGERGDGEREGMDIDFLSEIYIGRVPAEDVYELANWVYKTIRFENSADAPYRRNALMVSEWVGISEADPYAKPVLEEIRLGADLYGYATRGFVSDPQFNVSTLYDADGRWSMYALMSLLNSSQYALINHMGHGYPRAVMKMSNEDVDELTNVDPFFIYSQACSAGSAFVDTVAEHFVTSTRHGAAAVVMNSQIGHGASTTNGPSQRVNRYFWDAYFRRGYHQLGVMNAEAHERGLVRVHVSAMRLAVLESNLFGDPALSIAPVADE